MSGDVSSSITDVTDAGNRHGREDRGADLPSAPRAVPYCCPFCAEEDLRPVPTGAIPGLAAGGWHCRSCLRIFSLSFYGVHRSPLEGDLP
jgi:ribosomal protein L37AE/L43A